MGLGKQVTIVSRDFEKLPLGLSSFRTVLTTTRIAITPILVLVTTRSIDITRLALVLTGRTPDWRWRIEATGRILLNVATATVRVVDGRFNLLSYRIALGAVANLACCKTLLD